MKAFEYCKHHVAWSSMRNIKSHKMYHNKNDIKKALKNERRNRKNDKNSNTSGWWTGTRYIMFQSVTLIWCWRFLRQRYHLKNWMFLKI